MIAAWNQSQQLNTTKSGSTNPYHCCTHLFGVEHVLVVDNKITDVHGKSFDRLVSWLEHQLRLVDVALSICKVLKQISRKHAFWNYEKLLKPSIEAHSSTSTHRTIHYFALSHCDYYSTFTYFGSSNFFWCLLHNDILWRNCFVQFICCTSTFWKCVWLENMGSVTKVMSVKVKNVTWRFCPFFPSERSNDLLEESLPISTLCLSRI